MVLEKKLFMFFFSSSFCIHAILRQVLQPRLERAVGSSGGFMVMAERQEDKLNSTSTFQASTYLTCLHTIGQSKSHGQAQRLGMGKFSLPILRLSILTRIEGKIGIITQSTQIVSVGLSGSQGVCVFHCIYLLPDCSPECLYYPSAIHKGGYFPKSSPMLRSVHLLFLPA